MAHECDICWQLCYCDMEDTWFEQPSNCVHLRSPGMCVKEDDYYDADELTDF